MMEKLIKMSLIRYNLGGENGEKHQMLFMTTKMAIKLKGKFHHSTVKTVILYSREQMLTFKGKCEKK